jgi:hypothetical protein
MKLNFQSDDANEERLICEGYFLLFSMTGGKSWSSRRARESTTWDRRDGTSSRAWCSSTLCFTCRSSKASRPQVIHHLTTLRSLPTARRLFHPVYARVYSVFLHASTMDSRCEEGSFPVYASCMTISNPDSLFSNGTGLNPGIRSFKKHSTDWARCQRATRGIYFTKKVKSWYSTVCFRFWQFQTL